MPAAYLPPAAAWAIAPPIGSWHGNCAITRRLAAGPYDVGPHPVKPPVAFPLEAHTEDPAAHVKHLEPVARTLRIAIREQLE